MLSQSTAAPVAGPPSPARPISLHIPRRRTVVIVLYLAIAVLSVLSIAGQFAKHGLGYPSLMGIVPLFYVDLEANAPSWYQSLVFALGALLLANIGYLARQRNEAFAIHWLVLAAIFVFLSVDESAAIHELTMEPIQRMTGGLAGAWRPHWVIIGIAVVAVLAASYLRFFMHLDRRARLHLLAAGIVFLAGAIGTEMGTHAMFEVYDLGRKEELTYIVGTHIEEALEMIGLAIFIDFLLRRLEAIGDRP
jgi:hypothetical protein